MIDLVTWSSIVLFLAELALLDSFVSVWVLEGLTLSVPVFMSLRG